LDIFLRILAYVKPFWKHLLAAILNTFMFALMNGLSIYLTIPLLDILFEQKSAETVKKTASSSSSFIPDWIETMVENISTSFQNYVLDGGTEEVLLKIAFLIVTAFILKNIFNYLSNYFIAYVEQGVIRNLRDQLYEHIHKLPMNFFKNEKTGNLISRFTNDVNIIQQSITAVFLNLFQDPITI